MTDSNKTDIDIIDGEIITTDVPTFQPSNLPTIYVSGEHIPAPDSERRAAAQEAALVPVVPLTREDILHRFAAWMRLDVADGHASPETLRNYMSDVSQFLSWLEAESLTPAQASEDDLKSYRSYMLEDRKYSVSTVGRKLVSVRRFYQLAHNRGFLAHNPAEGLKAPRDKTDRSERVKYLTLAAIKQLLALPNINTPKGARDRAIMVLMIIHGLRVVEVHRANLEDLDLEASEAGTLRVFGKGDKWRTILLTEETREEIKRWLAVRELMHTDAPSLFVSLHWSDSGEPGTRISRRGIRQTIDGYLEAIDAKKPGISCHSLRHSFATHGLAQGAELLAVSKALGHASVTTTMVYVDIVEKAKKNPAKFLTGLLD